MRTFSIVAFFCVCLALNAQTVRTAARGRTVIDVAGATAAYTFDPDCADAQVEAGTVVLIGIRPCTTHLIVVANGQARGFDVLVSPSQLQVERKRAARLASLGIQEAGSISTSYSSDRDEVETGVDMARTMGDHSTSFSAAVANGYAFSALNRRTVIPRASLQFKSPGAIITLLDSFVPEAPTTIGDTKVRGLHIETNHWFLHGGIASLTNFREHLIDADPDHMVAAGFRTSLSQHSSLMTGVQWLSASSRFLSGRSGTIGSVLYRFEIPSRLRFEAEGAMGQGAGFGSSLEYTPSRDHLDLRVRSTSSQFASLSMSPARGLQSSGDWIHAFSDKFSLEISGAKNNLTRFDGNQDGNTSLNERLQWRFHRFTAIGGGAYSEFSHAGAATFRSFTAPLGLSFDLPSFGNSFQYQVGHNWGANNISQLLADSIRINVKPFSLHLYAGRQTQAPSLDYVLENLPLWLRNAILAAGVSITSPQDIQEFLNTHSDLIATGYINNFQINPSPMKRYAGGSLQWTAPHNRLTARFESRIDDDTRLTSHIISMDHNLSLSSQLGHNQFILGASFFRTELAGTVYQAPTVSFTVRHQLGNVPDFMTRLQERGSIHGIVYTDNQRTGTYVTVDQGIEGAVVMLDGTRRTRTNKLGWYSFGAIPPGIHTVEIQYQSERPYVFTSLPHVEVAENSTVNFGIAIRSTQLFGSVKSDAGKGLGGVLIHLSGVDRQSIETTDSGTFVFHLQNPGEAKVNIEENSLPPGYALNEMRDQTVTADSDYPGHADFVVRALRSIAGRVLCNNSVVSLSDAKLLVDGQVLDRAFDASGNYAVRDLTAGRHEFVLIYQAQEFRKTIDLGPEPATIRGADFELCPTSARR